MTGHSTPAPVLTVTFTAILAAIWWPYLGLWAVPFSLALIILTTLYAGNQ